MLALGLGGAVLERRAALRWLGLGLVGIVLALGSMFYLVPPAAPHEPGLFRLPLAWLSQLPGLDQMRLVFRYAALASLALAVLAATAVDRLPPLARPLAPLLVMLDLLLFAPGATVWLRSHPALEARACPILADLPPGPVVDVPGTYDGRHLYAQICHGRPVAQSVHQPWANEVRRALQVPPPVAVEDLRRLGFRWLVLHPQDRGEREQVIPALRTLSARRGAIVGSDDQVLVIDLDLADRPIERR